MTSYAESWLQLEAATGGRSALTGTVDEIRQQFAGLLAAISPSFPPPTDAVSTTDGDIQGTKYRVYTPKCSAGAASTHPLPLGIFTHGGGFILGDLENEDMLCRAFVERTETILVSVDYRLAPEAVHPAQLRDTLKVLEWAHANASSLGADPNKLYTLGDSSGGALALLAARDVVTGRSTVPASSLRGVVAVGPVSVHPDNVPDKYKAGYTSYTEYGEGAPVITRSVMSQFFESARLDPADASGFLLLDEESLGRFPRVYISTAECDTLRDDGKTLVAALKDAGVDVREDFYKGLPHCFWFFPSLPEWSTFIGNTSTAIRWVIS